MGWRFIFVAAEPYTSIRRSAFEFQYVAANHGPADLPLKGEVTSHDRTLSRVSTTALSMAVWTRPSRWEGQICLIKWPSGVLTGGHSLRTDSATICEHETVRYRPVVIRGTKLGWPKTRYFRDRYHVGGPVKWCQTSLRAGPKLFLDSWEAEVATVVRTSFELREAADRFMIGRHRYHILLMHRPV